MWILFNTAQFLVFIGMWQINYSRSIQVLFLEIKRIFLAEYIEDLEVGQKMSNAFGIETRNKVEEPQDNIGEDRMGSDDVFGNFGITLILAIFVFLLLIGLLFIVILMSRRIALSQTNKDRLNKFK